MTRKEDAHPLHALVVDERPEGGARVHAAAQFQLAHALSHGIHKRVVHAVLQQGQFGVAHLLMGQMTNTPQDGRSRLYCTRKLLYTRPLYTLPFCMMLSQTSVQ